MEHHFVVKFNAETRTWSWDTDTESDVFDYGTILVGDEWVRSGDITESHPHIYGLDKLCSKVLSHALDIMNISIKEADIMHPNPILEKKAVTEMDGVS